jgi:hypothetical protein
MKGVEWRDFKAIKDGKKCRSITVCGDVGAYW